MEYLGQGAAKSLKLMAWGTVTFHRTGILAFVESNMNFQKYISVLDEHLWPVIVKHFGKNIGISWSTDILFIAPERQKS